MSTPTFIVGTGRCGSTMLSNMLRGHPKVLSLSEFFAWTVDSGTALDQAFAPEPLDGKQFWALVAAVTPTTSFGYRHDIPCDEQLYPYRDPAARFSAQTGVPAILVTTLPHLTPDHDRLFDQLRGEVCSWPAAPKRNQYMRLFAWLANWFGKQLWVERSGAALHMLPHILATFPEARFIHVARDGRDVAISMQGHFGMRLYFLMSAIEQHLGVNPLLSPDRLRAAQVPEELRRFLPERFDAEAFRAFRVPLATCGGYWTFQVQTGLKALAGVPQDRLLTLRYEDILSEPQPQLETITAFLGDDFIDRQWSARCAANVRRPRSSWRDLPEAEAHALTEACRPGFEQVAATGVEYDV